MKMFRKVVSISACAAILCAAAAVLSGCNGSGDKTVLSVINYRPEDQAYYSWVEEEFEKANPDIDVRYEAVDTSGYSSLLNSRLTAEAVDVFGSQPADLANVDLVDKMLPLNDLKAEDGSSLWDQIKEGDKSEVTIDGNYMIAPLSSFGEVVFYNKTMFEEYGQEVPTTWSEFVELLDFFQSKADAGEIEAPIVYNKTDYLYQGEFGVNGASDEETLRRIFSEETLAHYRCPDVHWQLRNSSWWDSFPRDAEVFGEENLATPEAFVAASQLVQAEGLRYTIERNRARAFQCSGNCIWQFNEPFPNPNCTNLVDFFGLPKMAYSWVQKAFAVTTPLLRYERLFYRPGETADFVLAVSHFGPCAPASVTVRLRTPQKVLAVREYEVALKENHCTPVDEWHLPVEESFGPLFFLEVSVAVNGASAAKNLYSFGTDERAPYAPFFEGGSDLRLSCEYRAGAKRIRMANEGKEPCYFVSALPAARQAGVLTENNFVTVFPGEEETVIVACKPDEPVSIKDFTRKIHQTI